LNLSVGGSPEVGVTFNVSSHIALRPALQFAVTTFERDVRTADGDIVVKETTTQSGIDLDLLAAIARVGAVDLYLGAGASALFVWDSQSVSGRPAPPQFSQPTVFRGSVSPRILFGARVPVVDRLSVFGDLILNYSIAPRTFGNEFRRLSLETSALGITVYIG
jgi:hypothetical protein